MVVESPAGVRYIRNTSFVKKYVSRTPLQTSAEELQAQDVQMADADTKEQPAMSVSVKDHNGSHYETQMGRPNRKTKMPKNLSDYVIK